MRRNGLWILALGAALGTSPACNLVLGSPFGEYTVGGAGGAVVVAKDCWTPGEITAANNLCAKVLIEKVFPDSDTPTVRIHRLRETTPGKFRAVGYINKGLNTGEGQAGGSGPAPNGGSSASNTSISTSASATSATVTSASATSSGSASTDGGAGGQMQSSGQIGIGGAGGFNAMSSTGEGPGSSTSTGILAEGVEFDLVKLGGINVADPKFQELSLASDDTDVKNFIAFDDVFDFTGDGDKAAFITVGSINGRIGNLSGTSDTTGIGALVVGFADTTPSILPGFADTSDPFDAQLTRRYVAASSSGLKDPETYAVRASDAEAGNCTSETPSYSLVVFPSTTAIQDGSSSCATFAKMCDLYNPNSEFLPLDVLYTKQGILVAGQVCDDRFDGGDVTPHGAVSLFTEDSDHNLSTPGSPFLVKPASDGASAEIVRILPMGDNYVIAGTFNGNIVFSGGTTTLTASNRQAFVAVIDAKFNLIAAKDFGGAGDELIYDLAIAAQPGSKTGEYAAYLVGSFKGDTIWDKFEIAGEQDHTRAFIAKLLLTDGKPDIQTIYFKEFGDGGDSAMERIASNGHQLYVSGHIEEGGQIDIAAKESPSGLSTRQGPASFIFSLDDGPITIND